MLTIDKIVSKKKQNKKNRKRTNIRTMLTVDRCGEQIERRMTSDVRDRC